MGVFAWIVIGLAAGWLAAKITDSPRRLVRNLVVGLVGALLGGFLARKLGIPVVPDFWGELIVAIVGAVILLVVLRAVRRP
jgi:uncharacterized membrane protein YeaQ/YmgE (transglycosylase-associated protein family)